MAFYKACPSNMQRYTGFDPKMSFFMFFSYAMQSACIQFFSVQSSIFSVVSIINNLVFLGLSLLSIVLLLVITLA